MKTPTARWLRRLKLLPLTALVAVTPVQSGPHHARAGYPEDWSHHHVAFSNPGKAGEAARKGQYTQWVRTVNDPRYRLQAEKREANAKARVSFPLPAVATEREEPIQEAETPAARMMLDTRPHAALQTGQISVRQGNLADNRLRIPRRRTPPTPSMHTDWSVNLGSGANLGVGVYPAKWSFDLSAASCDASAAPDYVVFGTSVPGAAGQASIVAYDNLYTGCSGAAPMNFWAYDTAGGTVVNSVTLSIDGTQVAFVQSTAGAASLVVLRWVSNHALNPGAPAVLAGITPSAYYNSGAGCTTPPCMTVLPLSGGADDNGSSPFYDYTNDVLYVGDDAGALHQFTGIFKGVPTETVNGTWPVAVSVGGNALSSPVIDEANGNVLVGDDLAVTAPNCGAMGCGYLYKVKETTGAVVQSARLEYGFGIVDGVLLDPPAGVAYVFVGADSNVNSAASPCGAFESCSGVIQLSSTFSSGATGTETITGSGKEYMLAGYFDNIYFSSANYASPTGNLYVVGNTAGDSTLYQVPITANVMGAANTGPKISTNFDNGATAPAMGITEIYTGSHDYIFTSALIFGAPAACAPGSISDGCVMGFDVTTGMISGGTMPTGASIETGGVSGIIIDTRTVALGGTSNIYYTTLADQPCPTSGTTGGCAIQISQSTP